VLNIVSYGIFTYHTVSLWPIIWPPKSSKSWKLNLVTDWESRLQRDKLQKGD